MNYINIRELFHNAEDSYEIVRRLKKYERYGIKSVYIKRYYRIAIRYMMHIVVSKSQEGYSIEEIYKELQNQY